MELRVHGVEQQRNGEKEAHSVGHKDQGLCSMRFLSTPACLNGFNGFQQVRLGAIGSNGPSC